jgi:hypothetical protein
MQCIFNARTPETALKRFVGAMVQFLVDGR